jgi:hypothetical protein
VIRHWASAGAQSLLLAFSTIDEQVKKIATTIQISDELLEDAPAITTFINPAG